MATKNTMQSEEDFAKSLELAGQTGHEQAQAQALEKEQLQALERAHQRIAELQAEIAKARVDAGLRGTVVSQRLEKTNREVAARGGPRSPAVPAAQATLVKGLGTANALVQDQQGNMVNVHTSMGNMSAGQISAGGREGDIIRAIVNEERAKYPEDAVVSYSINYIDRERFDNPAHQELSRPKQSAAIKHGHTFEAKHGRVVMQQYKHLQGANEIAAREALQAPKNMSQELIDSANDPKTQSRLVGSPYGSRGGHDGNSGGRGRGQGSRRGLPELKDMTQELIDLANDPITQALLVGSPLRGRGGYRGTSAGRGRGGQGSRGGRGGNSGGGGDRVADGGGFTVVLICRGCRMPGHYQNDCPFREVTCKQCGKTGHPKRACPTLVSAADVAKGLTWREHVAGGRVTKSAGPKQVGHYTSGPAQSGPAGASTTAGSATERVVEPDDDEDMDL